MFDGRDSLRDVPLPDGVAYRGIGSPGRGRASPGTAHGATHVAPVGTSGR